MPTFTYIGSKKRAQQVSTYTYIGSKKEHSKCLLNQHREQERAQHMSTPTYGARKSTADAYLHLHRKQERAQQVPTYTYIGSKKEHSKCLLTPT